MKPSLDAAVRVATGRAPWLARIAAYLVVVQQLIVTGMAKTSDRDNLLVVDAVRQLLHGVSPYSSRRFLYPPSSIPFGLLQAPVPDRVLVRLFPVFLALMLLLGWWAVLRLFDVGLGSWLGVAGVAAFWVFNPASSVVFLGNWTAVIAGLMGVALLLMGRGRWLVAGTVIGLSIAIKPMLVPIGLVFLLARRWKAFGIAAGIPIVVCAAVIPLLPQPGLFFSKTLPFLLRGQDSYARPYDSSLQAILPRLGFGDHVVLLARIAVVVLALVVSVARWRRGGDERLRLVETSAILMIGTFLVTTPTFGYYPMIVLPAMVASVVVRGSVARSVWFWIAMAPLMIQLDIAFIDFPTKHPELRQAFKPDLWIAVVGTLLIVTTWRPRRAEEEPPPDGEAAEPAREPGPRSDQTERGRNRGLAEASTVPAAD